MVLFQQSGIFCILADQLIKGEVYSSYIQVLFISIFYLIFTLSSFYSIFLFLIYFVAYYGALLLIVSLYWHSINFLAHFTL